jgi:hypothetical protein
MTSFLTNSLIHGAGDFADSLAYGDYLGRQVVHAYKHPTGGFLMWDLPEKRIGFLVSPKPAYASSVLVSARSIGMRDSEFEEFALLSRRWVTLSAKELPAAHEAPWTGPHTAEFLRVKARIEELSGKIQTGLKAWIAKLEEP